MVEELGITHKFKDNEDSKKEAVESALKIIELMKERESGIMICLSHKEGSNDAAVIAYGNVINTLYNLALFEDYKDKIKERIIRSLLAAQKDG